MVPKQGELRTQCLQEVKGFVKKINSTQQRQKETLLGWWERRESLRHARLSLGVTELAIIPIYFKCENGTKKSLTFSPPHGNARTNGDEGIDAQRGTWWSTHHVAVGATVEMRPTGEGLSKPVRHPQQLFIHEIRLYCKNSCCFTSSQPWKIWAETRPG